MVIAVLVGLTAVATLVALGAGHLALRRRRAAQAAARQEESFLRRAARIPVHQRTVVDPVLHWVPDLEHAGWRLEGRYLPVSEREALEAVQGPRRRRRR